MDRAPERGKKREQRRNRLSGWFCLTLLALLLSPQTGVSAVKTFVSIAPQRYFVQKIGGDLVEVSVLVPNGASPHQYEPKPRQMAELSKSALYFSVGIDFERFWLPRIASANPGLRVVRIDEGIAKIPMAGHDRVGASRPRRPQPAAQEIRTGHGHGGESPDPHVWLSPALVKIQAARIRDALAAVDQAHGLTYHSRYDGFVREIDELDAELKQRFAGRQGERFMAFHPSWGYFARDYGLVQIPVEFEGKEPKPARLQSLVRQARENGIQTVFVQPQFSAKSAELLSREIGGKVVSADPLAEDWAANLREVARKFGAAAR